MKIRKGKRKGHEARDYQPYRVRGAGLRTELHTDCLGHQYFVMINCSCRFLAALRGMEQPITISLLWTRSRISCLTDVDSHTDGLGGAVGQD